MKNLWVPASYVCRALEYQKGRARDVLKSHVNKQHKHELEGTYTVTPVDWPKSSQPDEYYINEDGMCELLVGSQ